MPVIEAESDKEIWIDLEDGVRVQFALGGEYRSGDYWLIPARAATGKLEWPVNPDGSPSALPPHGIEHHYAPLGFVSWQGDGAFVYQSCRSEFAPMG